MCVPGVAGCVGSPDLSAALTMVVALARVPEMGAHLLAGAVRRGAFHPGRGADLEESARLPLRRALPHRPAAASEAGRLDRKRRRGELGEVPREALRHRGVAVLQRLASGGSLGGFVELPVVGLHHIFLEVPSDRANCRKCSPQTSSVCVVCGCPAITTAEEARAWHSGARLVAPCRRIRCSSKSEA